MSFPGLVGAFPDDHDNRRSVAWYPELNCWRLRRVGLSVVAAQHQHATATLTACATVGFIVAVSPKAPALAVATSPKPSQRSLRSDMCDLPDLGRTRQGRQLPQRRGYSTYVLLLLPPRCLRKTTGSNLAKLSRCRRCAKVVVAPQTGGGAFRGHTLRGDWPDGRRA
jgi:hypothetical protein